MGSIFFKRLILIKLGHTVQGEDWLMLQRRGSPLPCNMLLLGGWKGRKREMESLMAILFAE